MNSEFLVALKTLADKTAETIQAVLLFILLPLAYFFVFGIVAAFAAVFARDKIKRQSKGGSSYWVRAEGYDETEEECLRQS